MTRYGEFYTEFLSKTLNNEFFPDEDNEDEEYNVIEDLMENNTKYRFDNLPYNYLIARKELNDINKANPDSLQCENDNIFTSEVSLSAPSEHLSYSNRKSKYKMYSIDNDSNTHKNLLNSLLPSRSRHREKFSIPPCITKENKVTLTNSPIKVKPNIKKVENHSIKDENIYNNNNITQPQTQIPMQYAHRIPFYPAGISKTQYLDLPEIVRLSLKQFDFYLQLIIQNSMLSPSQAIKKRCLSLIVEFFKLKEQTIYFLNLPKIDLSMNLLRTFNDNKPLRISPQMSFFQAPILEIAPILENIISKTWTTDQTRRILQEFLPLINVYFLPVPKKKFEDDDNQSDNYNNYSSNPVNQSKIRNESNVRNMLGKKRATFDKIYDNLLTIGLHIFGKRNLETINKSILEDKSIQEIKHRIKNLTCQKASHNAIKRFKLMSESSLNKSEFYSFVRGMMWFGTNNKWNQISRFFLPERSPDMLEELFKVLYSLGYIEDCQYTLSIGCKRKKKKKVKLIEEEKYIDELAKELKSEFELLKSYNVSSANSINILIISMVEIYYLMNTYHYDYGIYFP